MLTRPTPARKVPVAMVPPFAIGRWPSAISPGGLTVSQPTTYDSRLTTRRFTDLPTYRLTDLPTPDSRPTPHTVARPPHRSRCRVPAGREAPPSRRRPGIARRSGAD